MAKLQINSKGQVIKAVDKKKLIKQQQKQVLDTFDLEAKECLEKIKYTVAFNLKEGRLKFNLDKFKDGPNGGPCDCKDLDELAKCYEVLEKALKY